MKNLGKRLMVFSVCLLAVGCYTRPAKFKYGEVVVFKINKQRKGIITSSGPGRYFVRYEDEFGELHKDVFAEVELEKVQKN